MTTVVVSQQPIATELRWRSGDPVSLTLTVLAVDWVGVHTAMVSNVDMPVAVSLISGTDTRFVFTLTLQQSALLRSVGSYPFWCKNASGRTRFSGTAEVVA